MTPLYWPTHITLSSSSTIMSHYPGVTVWTASLLFIVFVCCLFVFGICLVCQSVCSAVCMSYLSVCVHNLVLYLRFVYWPISGQNTINHLKSEVSLSRLAQELCQSAVKVSV